MGDGEEDTQLVAWVPVARAAGPRGTWSWFCSPSLESSYTERFLRSFWALQDAPRNSQCAPRRAVPREAGHRMRRRTHLLPEHLLRPVLLQFTRGAVRRLPGHLLLSEEGEGAREVPGLQLACSRLKKREEGRREARGLTWAASPAGAVHVNERKGQEVRMDKNLLMATLKGGPLRT